MGARCNRRHGAFHRYWQSAITGADLWYRLSAESAAGVFQLTGICRAEAAVATTHLLQEHREKVLAAMALTDLPAQSVTGPHGVGAVDVLAGIHTGLRGASWAHDM